MVVKKNSWGKLIAMSLMLAVLLGFGVLIMPGTASAAISVTVTGDAVTTPTTWSQAELEAMTQVTTNYSTINTWPTKKMYVARGVSLLDLVQQAGIKPEAKTIIFTATDGYKMTFTWEQLLEDTRYYFPGLRENDEYLGYIPGSPEGAVQVPTILALANAETDNMAYLSPTTTSTAPILMMGQRWVTEQTNNAFAKYVSTIEVTTETPAKWETPTAIPTGGNVAPGTQVALSTSDMDGDNIHYTTDGSDPGVDDPIYNWIKKRWWSSRADDLATVNHTIDINQSMTIKTFATGFGKYDSDIASFDYQVLVAPGPALTADSTDNTIGQAVDITFATDAAWEAAISGITVNGNALTSSQYTVTPGNINIAAEVFTAAGEYAVVVTATGYEDASVTQTMNTVVLLTPPALTADSTDNTIGQAVDITFATDAAWEAAISGVTVNGTALTSGQYTVSAGNINITADVFTAAGDYAVVVTATEYNDASITQTMNTVVPLTPPALTSDTGGNIVGLPINITFADDANWRAAISGVSVDGIDLGAENYVVASGKITIDASIFTVVKDYAIVIKASGYPDATVTQSIISLSAMEIGYIYTIAGNGTSGYSGDGGKAVYAQLNKPDGVVVDSDGNYYIADSLAHCVRKVDTDGIISTIAGTGVSGYSGDGGPATSAQLYSPVDVTMDGAGNLYIDEASGCRIRRVDPNGIITTVAGNGTWGDSGDGGLAINAQLDYPQGIVADDEGNLYIAQCDSSRIRKVDTEGIISTVAGTGIAGYSGDGGPATSAQLNIPYGVEIDGAGNLYITESSGCRIRKVDTDGIISTIAGTGISGYSGDGGLAINAQLKLPSRVAADQVGNLYIADSGGRRIRQVDSNGIITTVAGNGTKGYSGDGGPSTSSILNSKPNDVAVDSTGNLYITDTLNYCIRFVKMPEVQLLTPPALTADITDNTIGQAVDITFATDGAWEAAISDVSVNGTALTGSQYTVSAGNINIVADVFTAAGDYVVLVTATGYEDASVTQMMVAAAEIYATEILTWTDDPTDTQTITWLMSEALMAQVQYLEADEFTGNFDSALQIDATGIAFGTSHYRYSVTLSGLTADTQYMYRVGTEGTWSDTLSFTTAANTDEFSFLYMGDLQSGYDEWESMLDSIHEDYPELEFSLMGGDLTDNGYDEAEWVQFLDAATDYFSEIPLMPTLGNHDGYMYLQFFALPANGPEGLKQEFYSFDYGNAHFVVLNSGNNTDENVKQWLQADLQNSTQPWKFAMFHHPAYPAFEDYKTVDESICENWVPILEQNGVDMVFVGHQHEYMRTYPIYQGQIQADPDSYGIVYVMGNAGSKTYVAGADFPYIAREETGSNYQIIDIDGDIMTMTSNNANGELIESYTIDKSMDASPALIADETDNEVGQAIDITFTDDADWRGAITGISVEGSTLSDAQYTVTAGNINIAAEVFSAAGDYAVVVTAAGYEDAAVTQTINAVSPTALTVDGNVVGTPITYTLAELQAMPVTNVVNSGRTYTGVAVDYLLSTLGTVTDDWIVTIKIKDTINPIDISAYNNAVLAYERDGIAFADSYGGEATYLRLANESTNIKYVYWMTVTQPEILPAPNLTADETDNEVGQAIDITFAPDADWEAAITGISVDSSALDSTQYTVTAGNINIDAGVFTAAGDYAVVVTAAGYEDATVTQTMIEEGMLTAPELIADSSANRTGMRVDIKFADDAAWRAAITGIYVNGNALSEDQYKIAKGKIRIYAGIFSTAGDYEIIITADGYNDAGVIQTIENKKNRR